MFNIRIYSHACNCMNINCFVNKTNECISALIDPARRYIYICTHKYLYKGYIAEDMALDNYIRFFVLIFSLFGVYGGKQAIMYYVYVIYYICIL